MARRVVDRTISLTPMVFMRLARSSRIAPLATLAAVLILGGCDDDPVGTDQDHSEPVQVEIALGDVVIARAFVGTSTGFIGAQVNQETADLDVTFLDEENALVVPGSDEYLEVVVADGSVAVWESNTAGGFSGRIGGLSVGQTTAVFRFMHGAPGSGHADFESHPVNIIIN
jgi:hypothetical protein